MYITLPLKVTKGKKCAYESNNYHRRDIYNEFERWGRLKLASNLPKMQPHIWKKSNNSHVVVAVDVN